jgi:acyl carrier protein
METNMKDIDIKNQLRNYIISDILKDNNYKLDFSDTLISSGLIDSFSLVNIAVFIEKEIGINIPDNELTVETMDTIESMYQNILKNRK